MMGSVELPAKRAKERFDSRPAVDQFPGAVADRSWSSELTHGWSRERVLAVYLLSGGSGSKVDKRDMRCPAQRLSSLRLERLPDFRQRVSWLQTLPPRRDGSRVQQCEHAHSIACTLYRPSQPDCITPFSNTGFWSAWSSQSRSARSWSMMDIIHSQDLQHEDSYQGIN